VDIVVQVGHHVVNTERGGDDAVYNQVFLRCRERKEERDLMVEKRGQAGNDGDKSN
jgi:hypothetical protein